MNDIGKKTDARSAPFVSDASDASRTSSENGPCGLAPDESRTALPLYQPVVLMIIPFAFGILFSRLVFVAWQWCCRATD